MATGQQLLDAAKAVRDARAEFDAARKRYADYRLAAQAISRECEEAEERLGEAQRRFSALAEEPVATTQGREFI